jgi:deazaflavin-dependent oxidoreductase (nitroreductase family)
MLRLRTVGRRSGAERAVIVSYYLDGDAMVTIAMNGWADAHPAWLYNLRAEPHAIVDLVDGERAVVAREAQGAERQRLWDGYARYSPGPSLDDYATLRSTVTPVVVFEPTPDS